MTSIARIFTLFLMISILLAFTASSEGAESPKGFSLKDFGAVKVLIPDSWFIKTEEGDGTKAIFVTKELIETNGKFTTGLSVNIVKDVPKKTRLKPSEYVNGMMTNLTKDNQYRDVREVDLPPFKGYQGLIRSKMPTGEFYVLFVTVLGNDATGSAFICIFESPEKLWSETGKVGQVILQNLDVDEKY